MLLCYVNNKILDISPEQKKRDVLSLNPVSRKLSKCSAYTSEQSSNGKWTEPSACEEDEEFYKCRETRCLGCIHA